MTHAVLRTVNGVQALDCSITMRHLPRPRRFVWHHVLPQVCGGQTVPENVVSLCDNCHYTIHLIMWMMVHTADKVVGERFNREQLAIATKGYLAAQAAGTLDKMPKES